MPSVLAVVFRIIVLIKTKTVFTEAIELFNHYDIISPKKKSLNIYVLIFYSYFKIKDFNDNNNNT